ncbi:hypothetical protein [Chryseobacterium sp.]|uniref:hypothetical protein n=1 Tax=Chryseobacterium sp. TaxID=1871047 RepID=UPI0031D4602E
MKKSLLLIPLLMICCQKEKNIITQRANGDSTGNQNKPQKESVAIKVIENEPVTNKDEIIRTVDASQIPFILNENFTKDWQSLSLKITNYNRPSIKVNLINKNHINLRFAAIKLPDGSDDGPLPDEISFNTKGKGEVWLFFSGNTMAEGESTGNFSVKVE